jgi:ribonuclease P protein component
MISRSAVPCSGSLGFPRCLRLLNGGDFQAVFDAPDWRITDRYFLILAKRNQRSQARLGLVIGRRKARRAVDRGAIKRRAREQFRLRQHQLAGLDLIILLRGACPEQGGRSLTPELGRLLDKLLAKCGQD